MKLLAHFVAADIRRFRVLIAIWLVVAIAEALVQAAMPGFDASPQRALALNMAVTLLAFADMLLALSLVASVIQAHSLVGSDAFWMTRPVRWDLLLASKLALLGCVLVGVPVAAEVAHMAAYDVPLADMTAGALHMALFRTLGMLVVMTVAAMTPNIARFALMCGIALLAAALVATVGGVFARDPALRSGVRFYEPGMALAAIARERDFMRFVAAGVAALLTSVVTLGMQYRWRARQWSIGTAAAGAGLVLLLGSFRSWPAPAAQVTVPEWAEAPRAARLEGEAASLYFKPLRYGREDSGWRLGWIRFGVAAIPSGWVATARLAGASLEHPGGRISSPGHAGDRVLSFTDRNTGQASVPATIREILGVQRYAPAANASVGSAGDAIAFVAKTAEVPTPSAGPAIYRGEFVLTLTRIAAAAVLPIEPGATFAENGYRFCVERVERDDDGVRIFARTSVVRPIFDRAPQPTYLFFLRNGRRSEAIEANVYRNRAELRPVFPTSSAFSVSVFEMYLNRLARWPETSELSLDAAWLEDAEIVVVRTVRDGMLSRTLELSGLKLGQD